MGSLQAHEMAQLTSLEQGLTWHLQCNHYPPVPLSMLPVCVEAIEAYNEGDANRGITLPGGISYRGKAAAPAWAIVEQHHLDAWLDDGEDD